MRGKPIGTLGRAAIVVATASVAGAIDLAGCSDGSGTDGDAADVTNDFVTGGDAYGIPFDHFAPDVQEAGDADAADAPILGDAYGLPPDSSAD